MWYAASLMFEGIHPGQVPEQSLWEESIRLFEATDEDAAKRMAESAAQKNSVTFATDKGDSVEWKFVRIERIFEIGDEPVKSGSEVFSRFLRASEVASLFTPFE